MKNKKFNLKILLLSFMILLIFFIVININLIKKTEYINIEEVLNGNVTTEKEKEKVYLSTLEKFIFTDLQKIDELLVDSVSIVKDDDKSIYKVLVKLNRSNKIDNQQELLVKRIISLAMGDLKDYDMVIEYHKNVDT